MIDMLKRHEIQVLRRAGHTLAEVAALSGVSVGTVRRVTAEDAVATVDNAAERARRQVGRPVEGRGVSGRPASRRLIGRRRRCGRWSCCTARGRRATPAARVRCTRWRRRCGPARVVPLVRFEGLPGEFSQHDFGEVLVRYQDGTETKVHFFASRLKYSRWVEVTLVPDQRVETARADAGRSPRRPSAAFPWWPSSIARRRWRCSGAATAW